MSPASVHDLSKWQSERSLGRQRQRGEARPAGHAPHGDENRDNLGVPRQTGLLDIETRFQARMDPWSGKGKSLA